MAANPTSAVPTTNSLAPSGMGFSTEDAFVWRVEITAGALTEACATGVVAYRTCGVAGADSSESAKPTGTINAATIAASSRIRYRLRIARLRSIHRPGRSFFAREAVVRKFSGSSALARPEPVQAMCHASRKNESPRISWKLAMMPWPACGCAERLFTSLENRPPRPLCYASILLLRASHLIRS